MTFDTLDVLIAMASPSGGSGQGGPPGILQAVPLVLMIVVFYFILIRPQQKKAKEQEQLLKTLKAGDKVVTASGIVGTIVGVKDKTISLRTADTKVEVLKSSVTDITERGGSAELKEA